MRIVETTAGTFSAVTTAQVKKHLKVHEAITLEDSLIAEYLVAAREMIEQGGNRLVLAESTAFSLFLECWPKRGAIKIDRFPIVTIDAVKYFDTDGTEQTLVADTDYVVDVETESVVMINTHATYSYLTHPIEVEFTAGYTSSNFPGVVRAAIYQIVACLHIKREDEAEAIARRTWQRLVHGVKAPLYV